MTADAPRCARCGTGRHLHDNGYAFVCSDIAACRRNQAAGGDEALALMSEDWNSLAAPASAAPARAVCVVCSTAGGDLYQRVPYSSQYVHRDRVTCERNQAFDLAPLTPDYWDPSLEMTSAQMRAAVSAGGAHPVPAQVPVDPETAARAAFGRAVQQATRTRR